MEVPSYLGYQGGESKRGGMADLARLARPAAAFFDQDPVARWLIERSGERLSLSAIVGGLAERLLAAGLPLWRVTAGVLTIHPEVRARGVAWQRGRPAEESSRPHGIELTASYRDNPVAMIHQGAGALRRRLVGPHARLDFPLMAELQAEGATDYVIMPLPHDAGGFPNWIAFATDRPDGFSGADLARIDALLPLIALRIELEVAYHEKRSLLETYLGPNAAERVLAGTIRRGEGEVIRAAIWFSDMRNFTRLSDQAPAQQVIGVLNDYFTAMAGPIQAAGGEVLKFIGDAVLAIVPVQGEDPGPACDGVLAAGLVALRNLAELNAARASAGGAAIRAGIALHLGQVIYGNIGAPSRLDFTVIGPAVNEVTRIEALCKRVERPLLISSAFAAAQSAMPLLSLGFHPLRGIAEPEEVFTVPPERLPA